MKGYEKLSDLNGTDISSYNPKYAAWDEEDSKKIDNKASNTRIDRNIELVQIEKVVWLTKRSTNGWWEVNLSLIPNGYSLHFKFCKSIMHVPKEEHLQAVHSSI